MHFWLTSKCLLELTQSVDDFGLGIWLYAGEFLTFDIRLLFWSFSIQIG